MAGPDSPTLPTPASPGHHVESVLRLASLDGWRAICILFVLGHHCTFTVGFPQQYHKAFDWIFPGNLGVRFFFVISGFLITWLMLKEHDRSDRVSLKHFYLRRCLRIFPVYFTYLGILALLSIVTPYKQSSEVWVKNVTFTTNYFSQVGPWPSGHLWSLAIEEQFYLIWPGVLVIFRLAARFTLSLMILTLPVIIAPIARFVLSLHEESYFTISLVIPDSIYPLFNQFSTFLNFDSLAIGCSLAFMIKRQEKIFRRLTTSRPILVLVSGLILILVPHALVNLRRLSFLTIPFANTSEAIGFSILIAQSIYLPRFGPYRILNTPLLARIGVLSYSIYIWQQIFCAKPETFGLGDVWWMSFPGWLIPALVVAICSYYLLEMPFFRLRAYFR